MRCKAVKLYLLVPFSKNQVMLVGDVSPPSPCPQLFSFHLGHILNLLRRLPRNEPRRVTYRQRALLSYQVRCEYIKLK